MIKLLVFDVDGCLTDGSVVYDSQGLESKNFNVKDGLAIASWGRLGLKSAIITGRNSSVVARRAKELHISHLYQGIKDKRSKLKEILQEEGLELSEVAAIGDDLNDMGMLEDAGWSFAPNDASLYIIDRVDTVLKSQGGRGAVREMIEMVLEKNSMSEDFVKLWQ